MSTMYVSYCVKSTAVIDMQGLANKMRILFYTSTVYLDDGLDSIFCIMYPTHLYALLNVMYLTVCISLNM